MAKRRIVWTAKEKTAIVAKTVDIMRTYPKTPMFRAVGEAQEVLLPANRQRKWLTKATLGDLANDIQAALNKPMPKAIIVEDHLTDLQKAMMLADHACMSINDYPLQCVAWRSMVCGYMAGCSK
jgi:hypothetical protein